MSLFIKIEGQGSPVVLLHGWGSDHSVWQYYVNCYAKYHTYYLVDLPGFGQSPEMSWEQFIAALFAIVQMPFAIIAWSLGGLYAMRLASQEPAWVTRMLLAHTSPYFTADTNWPGINQELLQFFRKQFTKSPLETVASFRQQHGLSHQLCFVDPAVTSVVGLSVGLEQLITWDLRKELLLINKPINFIFGQLDSIIPIELVDIMRQRYPHCQYTIFKKAAHLAFISHRKEFFKVAKDLLL